MITPERLAAIEAREKAATRGPWARPLNTRYRASVTADMPVGDPASRLINNTDHKGNPERVTIVSCPIWSNGKFFRPQSGKDLEFIAHGREDIPDLVGTVQELWAELAEYQELCSKQAAILTRVANAVNGPPSELQMHSHHDVGERVEVLAARLGGGGVG
jgi:hypothetical protein